MNKEFEVIKIVNLKKYAIRNADTGYIIVMGVDEEEVNKICDELNNITTEKVEDAKKEIELRKCKNCAHSQIWGGETVRRCSHYHDSLCDKIIKFCKYEHYLDKKEGLSLYSFKSWLNRLTNEEMERPLGVHCGTSTEFTPLLMMEIINRKSRKWSIYCKLKEDDDE